MAASRGTGGTAPTELVEPATLTVETRPSGATVRIGERLLGRTPLTVTDLETGQAHRLLVEKEGFLERAVQVELEAAEKRSFAFDLQRRPPTQPAKRVAGPRIAEAVTPVGTVGYLTLKTEPWTRVFIDDRLHGSTPFYRAQLSAGRHSMRLVNAEAGVDVTRDVTISAGETTKLELDVSPPE